MSDSPTLRRGSPAERAERTLQRWIADGTLPAGARLPAENRLAADLGVSRTSLRRAFTALEATGLLRVENGGRHVAHDQRQVQRRAHGIIAVVSATNADGYPRQNVAGNDRDILHGALAALAKQELNALVLAPDRLYREGISPHITDLITGAVVLHKAAEHPSVRGFLADCAREHIPVTIQAEGLDLPGVDTVTSGHAPGSAALVAWLAAHGCRRIQRVWDFNGIALPAWVAQRDAGVRAGCTAADLPILAPLIVEVRDDSPDEAKLAHLVAAYRGLLQRREPPDAVLLLTDGLVHRHATALRQLGITANRDLPLCGFDGYLTQRFRSDVFDTQAPLLSVDKDNPTIGKTLVAVLRERLADPLAAPIHRTVPAHLLEVPSEIARWSASRTPA